MSRPHAALAMQSTELRDQLFTAAALDRLADIVTLDDHLITDLDDHRAQAALATAEVLVTGWGTPRIDAHVLDRAPRLRAVVHTAGTVKQLLDPVVWERGIRVSSAAAANARPVAEYTVAMIVLAGKRVFDIAADYRTNRGVAGWDLPRDVGNYGRTIGIVGASRTGRMVIELLTRYDVDVAVYDPWLTAEDADALGARLLSLDELVASSDIVSLHAPALPSTRHMIGARQLAAMRDGATLINTARGALVDHDALVSELRRHRLHAILDVTEPEPLPAGHPLFELPGVLVTPHVAGSLGNELRRLGGSALAEIERYVSGAALEHEVSLSDLAIMA